MRKQTPIFFTVFSTILLALFSALVYADAGGGAEVTEDAGALSRFLDAIIDVVAPAIGLVALWLARKGIKLFEEKSKIDVPDKIEARIEAWAEQGIALAEEKGRKAAKEGTEDIKGPEKLEMAANFVLDMMSQYDFFGWTRAQIENKLEAKLQLARPNDGLDPVNGK